MTRIHIAISVICLLVATGISAALPPDTEVVTGEWQGALYAIYVPASKRCQAGYFAIVCPLVTE